ncbi:MAG: single-stranded-DNA-specific exonuclease RecJ [Firmicutes bacterium]|nr:single-stranded-DNA-specific exonuclease RecJ [Bacillota bacterium]
MKGAAAWTSPTLRPGSPGTDTPGSYGPSGVWRIQPRPPQAQVLAQEMGVSPVLAALLWQRGIRSAADGRAFLSPDWSQITRPWDIPGMEQAVEQVAGAISRREPIWVYGDYDVDGVTSVSLLLPVLQALGARAEFYIPNRMDEGYGVHAAAVEEAARRGVRLLITVDCGISARAEVALARERGLDVVVTDHHQLPSQLPEAVVASPQFLPAAHPARNLSGVGVALKLVQGLTERLAPQRAGELWRQRLALVALGTVADVVPLLGENRTLVALGLEQFHHGLAGPGLDALARVAGREPQQLTARDLAFALAPRLNAAGRLADAAAGVRLLLTRDAAEAAELAEELDQTNGRRQDLEQEVLAQAEQAIAEQCPPAENRVLVVAGEGWHAGVIGIVASRLVERHARPVVVITLEGERGHGSGRSVPGWDFGRALADCSPLLERFGGHAMAGGLTLPRENIPQFRARINELAAASLPWEELVPHLDADLALDWPELTLDLAREIAGLEPFGSGNPEPVFVLPPAVCLGARPVGREGRHLQLQVASPGGNSGNPEPLRAIAFGRGDLASLLDSAGNLVQLAGCLRVDRWQDRESLEIRVLDLQWPAAAAHSGMGVGEAEGAAVEVRGGRAVNPGGQRSNPGSSAATPHGPLLAAPVAFLTEVAASAWASRQAMEKDVAVVSGYLPPARRDWIWRQWQAGRLPFLAVTEAVLEEIHRRDPVLWARLQPSGWDGPRSTASVPAGLGQDGAEVPVQDGRFQDSLSVPMDGGGPVSPPHLPEWEKGFFHPDAARVAGLLTGGDEQESRPGEVFSLTRLPWNATEWGWLAAAARRRRKAVALAYGHDALERQLQFLAALAPHAEGLRQLYRSLRSYGVPAGSPWQWQACWEDLVPLIFGAWQTSCGYLWKEAIGSLRLSPWRSWLESARWAASFQPCPASPQGRDRALRLFWRRALGIWEELGLCSCTPQGVEFRPVRYKLDLRTAVGYNEGEREKQAFLSFFPAAVAAPAEQLWTVAARQKNALGSQAFPG